MNQGKVVQHQPHGVSKVSPSFLQLWRWAAKASGEQGGARFSVWTATTGQRYVFPGTLRLKVACHYTVGHSSYLHFIYLPFSVIQQNNNTTWWFGCCNWQHSQLQSIQAHAESNNQAPLSYTSQLRCSPILSRVAIVHDCTGDCGFTHAVHDQELSKDQWNWKLDWLTCITTVTVSTIPRYLLYVRFIVAIGVSYWCMIIIIPIVQSLTCKDWKEPRPW